ncbi:MAG: C39 family peptidase [Bacilli bacterium]|nr:C39 family peptidase [Bacilli bacterium]
MEDYNITDYGIFGDAINTTGLVKSSIEACNDAIKQGQSILQDETIFMGPICDSCVEGFSKVTNKFTILNDNFTVISDYFIDAASTYKEGDDEASIKVLSFGNDGKMTSGTMSNYNYNGTPIYYNQKGYVGEDGVLHEWPTTWGKTIASSGCGPTSLASIFATLFGDNSITPTTIANEMSYDGNIGMNFVPGACKRYGLDYSGSPHLSKTNVNNFLQNNGKIMVAVRGGEHYIALLGVNNSTNPPTYIVNDPNDKNTATKVWHFDDFSIGHTMSMFIAPPGKTVDECLQDRTLVQV